MGTKIPWELADSLKLRENGLYELDKVLTEIMEHMQQSNDRYGPFTSTHEALGVAAEEFDELKWAIRANKLESIRDEAIDLAAVLIRLATYCRTDEAMKKRSVK